MAIETKLSMDVGMVTKIILVLTGSQITSYYSEFVLLLSKGLHFITILMQPIEFVPPLSLGPDVAAPSHIIMYLSKS